MYKLLNKSPVIFRIADNTYISNDQNSTDYQQYLVWLEAGNTPEPADIPPVVIPTLTMRQARLSLLGAGILTDVEAEIATPESRIWWDYSTTVERSHPMVNEILSSLGKTSKQIDDMFIAASLL